MGLLKKKRVLVWRGIYSTFTRETHLFLQMATCDWGGNPEGRCSSKTLLSGGYSCLYPSGCSVCLFFLSE